MGFNRAWRVMQGLVLFAAIPQARAQGTVEDYQRAQSFLSANLRHRVFLADVQANWIEKTSTFWYRRVGQTQTEFILVDAERNTSAPAFDHSRLAAGLSRAAKRAYDPSRLPFDSFEFVQSGKAIRLGTPAARTRRHRRERASGWNHAAGGCLDQANKNFDMLLVPNMYHGEGGNSYLVRRRWDYFVSNLLGVTPPANFEIKEDKDSGR